MALTKEKNIAIAAMNAKGMCIEAIAKKAGINKDEVRESLENRGRSYIELGIMSKEEKTEYIKELGRNGKAIVDIMELTGLGKTSVYNYLFGDKDKKCPAKPAQINEDFDKAVDEMIAEAETKKEPAPAATDTDSVIKDNIDILYPNDSTDEPKSQALNGVDFIGLFEGMLHEGYGDKAKIVKVIADKEKASVVFECEGRAYNLNFVPAF